MIEWNGDIFDNISDEDKLSILRYLKDEIEKDIKSIQFGEQHSGQVNCCNHSNLLKTTTFSDKSKGIESYICMDCKETIIYDEKTDEWIVGENST